MIATPDWGPLSHTHDGPEDHYGRHDAMNIEHWLSTISEAEFEIMRRAEQVETARSQYGEDYFPPQHSLAEGAGFKVTVGELASKVRGGCAWGCSS